MQRESERGGHDHRTRKMSIAADYVCLLEGVARKEHKHKPHTLVVVVFREGGSIQRVFL